ncbi:MAG: Ammonia channel protein AmtB [Candidatus Alkanophagales archaeon MCA70_species_2]|nr:Ammonia channel protein AmtB [Candidatus Alkanophaga liquidiphilum]
MDKIACSTEEWCVIGGLAANAFVTTNTAAASAALTWMILSRLREGKPSTLGTITGDIAGLAPRRRFRIAFAAAIAIGIGAGIVCYFAVRMKKNMNDPLDVWGVHGISGMLGTLAVGIFASVAVL